MSPERFGGRGHQLGPLWLMLLPALAVMRRLQGLGALLTAAVVYLLLWYALRQNLRFLLVLLPAAAAAAAWVLAELSRLPRYPRRVAYAAVALVLALEAGIPAYRARLHWAVALGSESRDGYLRRQEPSFRAAELGNALLATCPGAHLLSQDYRSYYFSCPVTRESVYRAATHYDQALRGDRSLSEELRRRGFSHVLLAQSQGPGIRFDETLARLVDGELSGPDQGGLLCLCDYRTTDSDGAERRYRLYWLR